MDINYWVIASQDFINELYGKTQNQEVSSFFSPPSVSVSATQFPLLNYLKSRTRAAVTAPPEWYANSNFRAQGSFKVIQLYSFETEYSLDVDVREDLMELEDAYPNDCIVAGCWDVATGEPVGGVGSPWFVTPPELINYMPHVPLPPNGDIGPPDKLYDVNLLAGQRPRKFV